MDQPQTTRFLFWHKLLVVLGGAMILLALGLTLAALSTVRRASIEIGIKGKQILAAQTERFLDSIITGQADTIDLQLDQARIGALHGAATIKNLLKVGILPSRAQLVDLLANAGPHSTTIYYLTQQGKLTFATLTDEVKAPDRQLNISEADFFPDFGDISHQNRAVLWSAVHQNPLSVSYDRVVDAVTPVYLGGELEGYLGISISVIRQASQFNHRQTIRGSYTFLMDSQRRLVSAPPHATAELATMGMGAVKRGLLDLSNSQDHHLDAVLNNMVLGNRAVEAVHIKGRPKYLAYRPLEHIDWSIGLAVPEALATASSEQLVRVIDERRSDILRGMLITTLVLLGTTLIAAGLITRRLTRPLQEMAFAAQLVAKGDLDHTISVTGKDEISALAGSFNTMTRQLNEFIGSLERHRQDLSQSEARYRTLFEKSPISLWEEDFSEVKGYLEDLRSQGIRNFDTYFSEHPELILHCAKLIRIVDVNEATVSLYAAKTKEDLLGNLPKILTDESMSTLKQELIGIAEGRMFEIECTNKTLDGRILTLVLRSSVPPGYEDTWRKVFISAYDITDRALAERENRRLEEHLRQAHKMEAIGTLAGGIAHDFNNILSAILGYAQLLQTDPKLSEHNLKHIGQVVEAGLRAKKLVGQILTFSRQDDTDVRPIRIKPVILEALRLIRASLPTTIEIHQDLPRGGVVMADPTQIHQVVMNLCTNASQAMAETGGVLRVCLDAVDLSDPDISSDLKPGGYVKLSVTDSGEGIPPEVQNRIFDPFFTTRGRGKGTGMGLAVVHGIVQSIGGQIELESAPGKGSTFIIHLPLADDSVAKDTAPKLEEMPRGDESILFLDDEAALVWAGKQMLETLGYRVTPHTDSVTALEDFEKRPEQFDLIISDVTMPQLTGEQFALAVRKVRKDIKILLCSGYNNGLDIVNLGVHGVDAFMPKPLMLDDLSRQVRRLLDGSEEDFSASAEATAEAKTQEATHADKGR